MKLYIEGLDHFEPWSGAVSRWQEIEDWGKVDELEDILEDIYPEGMSMTQLNDFIWFEEETWRDWLDMNVDEDED